jgi:hypothetical protein
MTQYFEKTMVYANDFVSNCMQMALPSKNEW